MLRALQPSRWPLLQAAGIGAALGVATLALYAALVALGADAGVEAGPRRALGPAWTALGVVLAAPLVETLLMAGLLEAGRRLLPWTAAVVVGLAALAHSGRGWFVLGVVLAFAVFTALYLAYRARLGRPRAVLGAFVAHATVNAMSLGAAIITGS